MIMVIYPLVYSFNKHYLSFPSTQIAKNPVVNPAVPELHWGGFLEVGGVNMKQVGLNLNNGGQS